MSQQSDLSKLIEEHRDLEATLRSASAGDPMIGRLQKRKLSLQAEIARLQAQTRDEANAARDAHSEPRQPENPVIGQLRTLASESLAGLNSEQTSLVGEVKAYLEWLDDKRPEIALGSADKFGELVALSRHYQPCNKFYLGSVGVSESTVWRWAQGKSRPSRYVGERVSSDIKALIAESLWQRCREHQLLRGATVPLAAYTQTL